MGRKIHQIKECNRLVFIFIFLKSKVHLCGIQWVVLLQLIFFGNITVCWIVKSGTFFKKAKKWGKNPRNKTSIDV